MGLVIALGFVLVVKEDIIWMDSNVYNVIRLSVLLVIMGLDTVLKGVIMTVKLVILQKNV